MRWSDGCENNALYYTHALPTNMGAIMCVCVLCARCSTKRLSGCLRDPDYLLVGTSMYNNIIDGSHSPLTFPTRGFPSRYRWWVRMRTHNGNVWTAHTAKTPSSSRMSSLLFLKRSHVSRLITRIGSTYVAHTGKLASRMILMNLKRTLKWTRVRCKAWNANWLLILNQTHVIRARIQVHLASMRRSDMVCSLSTLSTGGGTSSSQHVVT